MCKLHRRPRGRALVGWMCSAWLLVMSCAPASNASIIYDSQQQLIRDNAAQRVWKLHGVGFGSSYLFPTFAEPWVSELNAQQSAGLANWRLPTVPFDGTTPPQSNEGELAELYAHLLQQYPSRDDWPSFLGSSAYGGNIFYTVVGASPGNFWGLSFGSGNYVPVYVGNAYAYVGVMAVAEVPEPRGVWLLVLSVGVATGWRLIARHSVGLAPRGS